MPITDADAIEEHTQLSAEASAKVVNYAPMAEQRLRQLVTDATYDEIAGDTNHDDYDRLQRAESLLSLYYGFQFLNLRPTSLGGFSKVIGIGPETNEILMSQKELNGYRAATYDMAFELLDGIRVELPEDPDEFDKLNPCVYDAGPIKIA